LVIAGLEIPSILIKKIEGLKFMAFIGVSGILVFMGTFVIYYFITASDAGPSIRTMNTFPEDWFGAISSIPNLILALGFQMNFFPVYKGMRKASDRKMSQATLAGILVCSASYLLIGILGYHLVYSIESGDGIVQANFLSNISYDPDKSPIIYFIINCGFLLSVFFAFPIMFFGCRNNFIALLQLLLAKDEVVKKWRQNSDNVELISSYIQSEDNVERKKKANRLFYIYTFSIFAVIVVTGVLLNDIEAVFNIIGAVCSTSISVLLPCFFYFILVIKKKKPRNIKFYVSIAVFIIMAPFALFSVVAKYVE
jgi:amino acid permease